MSQDQVFTVFEDVRRRALGLGEDETERKGFVVSLMPVGLPINQADFANPWTPSGGGGATPEETKKRQQSLQNLSRLLDAKLTMDGKGDVMPGSTPISDTWKAILESAETRRGDIEPDPDVVKRVQAAEEYLFSQDKDGVPEKSGAYAAYDKYQTAWENARLQYSNEYQTAATAGALEEWPVNGTVFLERLRRAEDDWTSLGKRQKVESALATIAAQGKDAIEAVIAMAKKAFDPWQLALNTIGVRTPYVQVFPSNWASPDDGADGWVRYGYSKRTSRTTHDEETTSWGASGRVSFGFWSVGGSGGSSEHRVHDEFESSDLEIQLSLGTAMIDRPWLRTILLNVSGWALVGQDGGVISDGTNAQSRPSTNEAFWLPSVPTRMILVRNVRIRTGAIQQVYDELSKHVSGGGSVGWGPFSVGGSYTRDTFTSDANFAMEGGWLVIRGVQLIGWISDILPASPSESGR